MEIFMARQSTDEAVQEAPILKTNAVVVKPEPQDEKGVADKGLTKRAGEIRTCDERIVSSDRTSMADALCAGEHLLWVKQDLKKSKA